MKKKNKLINNLTSEINLKQQLLEKSNSSNKQQLRQQYQIEIENFCF
jgi:hypothetical protein